MSFSGDSRCFLVFFYTLTKIHKPVLTGRPIISGCDGPTERISSFLDHILQPIAKVQKSYLKDTTQFINFIEKRKVPNNAVLVSMDVSEAPARAKRTWDRAPYSWNMVNLFSFGCHVIDRAYVRTYVHKYIRVYRLYWWGRGDYQKEGMGVSGVSSQVHIFNMGLKDIHNMVN